MNIDIDDPETIRLVEWIGSQTGENADDAILAALKQRAASLGYSTPEAKAERVQQFINEVSVPKFGTQNKPLAKEEVEDILGFGPYGV